MRIVLADCYHDSDKGGGGIIAGALRSLDAAWGGREPEPRVDLMFRFSEDDPKFRLAARHTARAFPRARILPAPLSSRRGPGLHWLSWAFRAFVVATARLLFPGLSRHPGVRALREADLVIFKGGHFYRSWSRWAPVDLVALYLLTFPILMAIRLRRPFCLLSHSFGPFHSSWSRRLVRAVLRRARYVSCREPTSRQILLDCGLEPHEVAVTPDLAFGAVPEEGERVAGLLERYGLPPGGYVAVTARPWFHAERRRGRPEAYRAYIAGLAALCDHAVERHAARVALVVQNDGAHSVREPDLAPLRDIQGALRRADASVILEEDLPHDALMGIYGRALLTLGTRLHSCIFSACVGTPPIAVAYSHKADGIMTMLGAGEFVLRIDRLSVAEGQAMIDRVVAERAELSAELGARVHALRGELRAVLERLLCESARG